MNQDKHTRALNVLKKYNMPYLSLVYKPYVVSKSNAIISSKLKYCINDLLSLAEIPQFDTGLLVKYEEKSIIGLTQNVAEEQAEYNKFSSWYNNYINELQELIGGKGNISFMQEEYHVVYALDFYLYNIKSIIPSY